MFLCTLYQVAILFSRHQTVICISEVCAVHVIIRLFIIQVVVLYNLWTLYIIIVMVTET